MHDSLEASISITLAQCISQGLVAQLAVQGLGMIPALGMRDAQCRAYEKRDCPALLRCLMMLMMQVCHSLDAQHDHETFDQN